MGKLWVAATAAAAVCLAACGDMDTDVRADANPAYSVNAAEPMFVGPPEKPTLKDTTLVPFVRDEMQRSGFSLADTIENARWVIVGSNDVQDFYSGTMTPFSWHPRNDPPERKSFYLVVYPADLYLKGEHQPAWAGVITAHDDEYYDSPNAVVHALLGLVGQNIDQRDYPVDPAYQKLLTKKAEAAKAAE